MHLTDIAKGVRQANEGLKESEKSKYGVFRLRENSSNSSTAKIPGIKFDVGVTAVKGQTDKAGFFVALVNIGGGAKTEKTTEGQKVHRIHPDGCGQESRIGSLSDPRRVQVHATAPRKPVTFESCRGVPPIGSVRRCRRSTAPHPFVL